MISFFFPSMCAKIAQNHETKEECEKKYAFTITMNPPEMVLCDF